MRANSRVLSCFKRQRFTRLASRLRESGKRVIGMGEAKTPLPFRKACEIFTELELLLEDNMMGVSEREEKTVFPYCKWKRIEKNDFGYERTSGRSGR